MNKLSLNFGLEDDEPLGKALFGEILLPIPLTQTFTYRIPRSLTEQASPGKRVIVPFGRSKIYTGLIFELHQNPPKSYSAKLLIDIIDQAPIIRQNQQQFWHWLSQYYCIPLGEIMANALPANMKMQSETILVLQEERVFEENSLSDNAYIIYEILENKKEISIKEVQKLLQIQSAFKYVKELYDEGYIQLKEEIKEKYRPRIKKVVRLAESYLTEQNTLKELFDELEAKPQQLQILMAYLKLKSQKKIAFIEKSLLINHAQLKSPSALNTLVKHGVFEESEQNVDRVIMESKEQISFDLSPAQDRAFHAVKKAYQNKNTCLLHGITGSGKTNIYIKLIQEMLELHPDKQILYLVPEIALSVQLVRRLKNSFKDRIGIYHSKFNPNERVEIWHKVLKGEYQIVLGVKSAIFLPFRSLSLVVVDEEHESNYKQSNSPLYNAKDSAIYLAHQEKAKVILGSATPSMESYHNALNGKYALVELKERYGNVQLPEISIIDLKYLKREKQMKGLFSPQMLKQIEDNVKEEKQVILFQNRRGFAPYLNCKQCGWNAKCEDCDISLTFHKYYKHLTCHYCGYKQGMPKNCPACGSPDLQMQSFGTEKIEEELSLMLPSVRCSRLDQDTTRKKDAFEKIIEAFEKKEADVMVGTQMVTKGLDFESVNMVAIPDADQILRIPDFRAQERAFQMITQVAGRAGRRAERGQVLIQTHQPKHFIFGCLLQSDYVQFYRQELQERHNHLYPPFVKLIKLVLKDLRLDKIKKGSHDLAQNLYRKLGEQVLGPILPQPMRLKKHYIAHILLKLPKSKSLGKTKALLLQEIQNFNQEPEFKSIKVQVNVDP